jgi:hypothetical protein
VLCGKDFVLRSNRQKACSDCRLSTDGHRPVGAKRLPDPVCVDCGKPYPRRGGPLVTRCESCQAKRDDPEHDARMRRIEASAPPASTFEGQLQRRVRDRQDDELEVVWDGKRGHDGASLSSDLFRRAATEQ